MAMPNLNIIYSITVINPRGVQYVDYYLCFAIIFVLGSVTHIPLADDTYLYLVL
jgi:hypothetical protein